jgi:hypothetical protein
MGNSLESDANGFSRVVIEGVLINLTDLDGGLVGAMDTSELAR